jgi:predicted DNA-binding transcriptional regulator AlpA
MQTQSHHVANSAALNAGTEAGAVDAAPQELKKKLLKERREARVEGVTSRFDALPNAAGVNVRAVAVILGCSIATVWNRAKRGDIPQPRKIGGSTLWNVGELRAVLMGEPA